MRDVSAPSKRSGRLKSENQNIVMHLKFDQVLSVIAAHQVKDDAQTVRLLSRRNRWLRNTLPITRAAGECCDDKSQSH